MNEFHVKKKSSCFEFATCGLASLQSMAVLDRPTRPWSASVESDPSRQAYNRLIGLGLKLCRIASPYLDGSKHTSG